MFTGRPSLYYFDLTASDCRMYKRMEIRRGREVPLKWFQTITAEESNGDTIGFMSLEQDANNFFIINITYYSHIDYKEL
jgi:hypothetical protein